ncbi:MAG: hypothetical protein ACE5H9_18315 [Anaerolineae bacterium]
MSATSPADEALAAVAAGLAGRLRSLVLALDRLDRLESGSGGWLSSLDDAELSEAAAELTLRALRTVADPGNFAVLKALAPADSQSMGWLIETTGLGRLALSERLNDLVQVGLVTRLIDTDHVQITAAGAGMVHLIEALAAGVIEQYSQRRKTGDE